VHPFSSSEDLTLNVKFLSAKEALGDRQMRWVSSARRTTLKIRWILKPTSFSASRQDLITMHSRHAESAASLGCVACGFDCAFQAGIELRLFSGFGIEGYYIKPPVTFLAKYFFHEFPSFGEERAGTTSNKGDTITRMSCDPQRLSYNRTLALSWRKESF
jgi:hypothetical protein